MTPSFDKKPPLDRNYKNDLLNAIGNPNATEEEWLAACEKLGDHQPSKPRKQKQNSAVALWAVSAVLVGTAVYQGACIVSLNAGHKYGEKVAPAPVPAAAEVDFGPYMADLQRRIKRQWYPPKGNESKRVKVRFKIYADGRMENLQIKNSAGVAVCDRAALDAVENAAPFKPLPPNASNDVDIEFTFDYNVWDEHQKKVH